MEKRLTRTDWLDHGLRRLAQDGPTALKADRLARTLGVSRGSFYWHFTDLADFHAAVLAEWRRRTTDLVIAAAAGADDQLAALIRRAFRQGEALERAVRAWGAVDPRAGAAVAAVDRTRLDHLTALFTPSPDARARALTLYWAYIGRMAQAPTGPEATERDIEAMIALFRRDEGEDI